MVRGRRVKAVVACARNDDCCSPNPKRKDQKVGKSGKLSHLLSNNNKTHTITEFFQAVEIDDPKLAGEDEHFQNAIRSLKNNSIMQDLESGISTPLIQASLISITSPPTPHRIELCDNKKSEPPKARKRLNVNPGNNVILAEKNNHKLTEYFPVRRSVRKTKKTVLEEKRRSLEQTLRSGIEEGLEVRIFEEKGRGVVASKDFQKGDFVVEYSGDLIDCLEAKKREEKYAQDQNTGCYMYYFKHNDQQYCIDATAETGKLGRLVNHSRNGNLLTRTIMVDRKPRLVLIAKDDIKVGEEVLYDYGDRSKESLQHHPWLAN